MIPSARVFMNANNIHLKEECQTSCCIQLRLLEYHTCVRLNSVQFPFHDERAMYPVISMVNALKAQSSLGAAFRLPTGL